MVGSAYLVKSTPPRAFGLGKHGTDVLKMCMKNYNAEKIIFDKITAFFNFAIFFTIALIQQWLVVHTL